MPREAAVRRYMTGESLLALLMRTELAYKQTVNEMRQRSVCTRRRSATGEINALLLLGKESAEQS